MKATEPIVVYPSRSRTLGLVAGSLLFVMLGAFLTLSREDVTLPGNTHAPGLVALVGMVTVLFSAAAGAYGVYGLVRRLPVLVIDATGLLDVRGAGLLRWDEIEAVTVYEYRGHKWLGVVPRDVAALLARQGSIKAMLMRANIGLGLPPVNFSQTLLLAPVEALAAAITERCSRNRRAPA